eukprot:tig00020553_g10641.t1
MWFFLDRLIREDSNEYFFEPVDEEEVPGYSKMVKYPMDFSTMRNKLNSGQYTTIQNFWDDYMSSTSVFPPVSGGLENLVQQPEGKTDCDVTTAAHRPPVVKQLADPFPVFDVAFALFSSVLTKFNERFMTVDTAYLVNRMLERLGDAIFRFGLGLINLSG